MAFPTISNVVLSLKLALISTGILSIAVALKLCVPLVTDFAVSELPVIYGSFLSWLQPPYLYLVINGIIISIVASSKLQKPEESSTQPVIIHQPTPAVVATKASADISSDYIEGVVVSGSLSGYQDLNVADKVVPVDDRTVNKIDEGRVVEQERPVMGGGDEAAVSYKSVQHPQKRDSVEDLFEKEEKKPLVSARFGSKKSVKANPEGTLSIFLSENIKISASFEKQITIGSVV